MNAGIVLLLKSLLTISFCLKGAFACPAVVYGVVNDSVHLCTSFPQDKLYKLDWKKSSEQLAYIRATGVNKTESERYFLFPNGTLKLKRLEKSDAANYTVEVVDGDRKSLGKSTITLHVVEPLPQPRLTYDCHKKTLSCEVKYNEKPKVSFKLFQDKEEQKKVPGSKYVNGTTWKVTHQKNYHGKVRCEASSSIGLQKAEIQVSCSVDIFLIIYIVGGICAFGFFVAVLICCIKKNKAKRYEQQAEERELQAAREGLKYRKLPDPPIQAAPGQPPQQPRQPPPHPPAQQEPCPPLPRPRPHQKPPRRRKENL